MKKFTKAITRQPGKNFAKGLTTAELGKPIYESVLKQHKQYINGLRKCGLEVTVLEPDEKYPDGCFVEDTAIITDNVSIITNPGDVSRRGEEGVIKSILSKDKDIRCIRTPGYVDGGDILRVDNHFYIGLSKRTNQEGARQLSEYLKEFGYTSSTIPVKSVLHLKTGITYIQNNNFLSINEFSSKFSNKGKVIAINKANSYCANCIFINNNLIIPAGFPGVKERLVNLGYNNIIEIEMTEFEKMDGGLTCLSLIY